MNIIQDYMNRLNLTDSRLKKAENLGKTQDENGSSFQKTLNSVLPEKMEGKISSSMIKVPNNIKEETSKDPYRKKLFDASVEFESIFVKLMLKEMKNSVHKEGLIHGGHAEEIFEDMLYDEYAKNISQNESLGLAEEIYNTLSRNLPPVK
ncbi:MAG TPA: rod-binding protein [Leptospiraceae bacterium]|nr:rod-binding protein [Leptospiraceae bacterium]HMY67744.1 rod-binding protein [Leptospiraceae bacterium]HMZ62117.1 rod-binding protein [Leptospiraceae bacterium]HNF16700.1 rod-binding protein [Leptospiraceae bacterium]HNF26020.1 rod-binding protein [Leptospiraceae bacterium]